MDRNPQFQSRAEMYAGKAKEAQVNAEASKDEQARQSWLRIAEGYLNLARHAEKSRP